MIGGRRGLRRARTRALPAMVGLVSRVTADRRIAQFPPAQHSTTCTPLLTAVEVTARLPVLTRPPGSASRS